MSLIYKQKQGGRIRGVSFACLFVLFTFGAYRLYMTCFPPPESIEYGWISQPLAQYTIPLIDFTITASYSLFISLAVWLVLTAVSFLLCFAHARLSNFLIDTESEMHKVSWPTNREVITSSIVVIITIFILGVYLYFADILLDGFFKRIF